MRRLFAFSSWFVQRPSLTVNIDLSDVTNRYTVPYPTAWYVRKRIDHWCSVFPEKSQPSSPQFSGKLGKPVGPQVGIFLSPLDTNDGFYLSHIPIPALGKDKKRTAARWLYVDPWRHCNVKMWCRHVASQHIQDFLEGFFKIFPI